MLVSILPELVDVVNMEDEIFVDNLINDMIELFKHPNKIESTIESDPTNNVCTPAMVADLDIAEEPLATLPSCVSPVADETSRSKELGSVPQKQSQPMELEYSREYVDYQRLVCDILNNYTEMDSVCGLTRKANQKGCKKSKTKKNIIKTDDDISSKSSNGVGSGSVLENRMLHALSYDVWISILDALSYLVMTEDISEEILKQQQEVYMECCNVGSIFESESVSDSGPSISEYTVFRLLSLLFSVNCITSPTCSLSSEEIASYSMNFNYSDFEALLLEYVPGLSPEGNSEIPPKALNKIKLACMHMLLLNLCRCMLMPDEAENNVEFAEVNDASNDKLVIGNDTLLAKVEDGGDRESIGFLTNMFPQIPNSLIVFLYEHKFGKNQSGVAEYLATMLYNNAFVEGLESYEQDSEQLILKIIEKIKVMKQSHLEKIQSEKKARMLKRRKIQEMIRNKYEDVVVTPLYDEKTGKLIEKKYDPKTFLGVTTQGYISSASKASSSDSNIFNWGRGAIVNPQQVFNPKKKKGKAESIRYLDNQVVTHKGEKTIVVKSEYEKEQALLYGGPLRGKENKGSLAKAAAAKAAKTKSSKK